MKAQVTNTLGDVTQIMNITVYLGAGDIDNAHFKDAVRELGLWIAQSGNTLVYGGSKTGLMGVLANAVLDAGGKVVGVEAQFFMDAGVEHKALTELVVVKDMATRKSTMIKYGDAFIAFPGGTGTLEEISEVMSKVSLGQITKPCILYNLDGYYDNLKAQLLHMIDVGLSSESRQKGIYFASNLAQIKQILGYEG